MSNYDEGEVPREEYSKKSFGQFTEKWVGKFPDKPHDFMFQITFDDANETARAFYTRTGGSDDDQDRLDVSFKVSTVRQLGPKTTVHLTDANGTWERAGKKPVKVENEEMNCFVHGSQMVFGLVMPHVFLHEAALKTRKLIRPLDMSEVKPH